ncbi:MAG: CPBP family intramembrane metalloprotease [Acidobacteria bacterium]|nr:CPBP family intramembrane metalloprotease [Acidobacteriota bacterium]MCA1639727.1 CPBP family intramembrane metalloprotease [Acidobacteriota bacterium]
MNLELFFVKLSLVQNYEQQSAESFPKIEPQEIIVAEKPTPNNPPWNSWLAFLVWLASIAFILILPNLFVVPYILKQGIDLSDQAVLAEFVQSDATAVLLSVLAVIPAHILTLALAWVVITKFNKFSFRKALGWRSGGFNVWAYFLILGGFFILASIVSYYFPEQDNDLLKILRSSRTAVYIVAFLATFTAPLVEEVVYRGVLYSALQRSFRIPYAVLLVTFLFALVHVPQYYPSYSTIFLICLLSLILTLVRVRTKNLLPCIILHTIFNGVQSLFLILQPYLNLEDASKQAASIIYFLK